MDPTPGQDESEEEEASGLLRFTVNGSERIVPELKWRANDAWKREIRREMASLVATPADTPQGLEAMFAAELRLVLAYDATHELGDLEDATEREVSAIYDRLVTVAYPLASSPAAAMEIVLRAVVESVRGSSSSSDSPSGTSDRTPSGTRSRSGKSASSTATRGSGRRAAAASG